MNEVYFDRREFNLKGNFSVNKKGLTPLVNPEMFLTTKLQNYLYPVGFADNVPSRVRVFCGMLLTDNLHDGIWLVEDDRDGSLSIPGKCITDMEWDATMRNPWRLIHKTFLNALKDLHPLLRDDIDPALQGLHPWMSSNYYIGDMIMYAIHKYGVEFTTESMVKDGPMYFQYKDGLGIRSDSSTDFMVFQVWEINKPDGHIPALISLRTGNLIWYSRQDHVYNLQERGHRRNRLFSGFKDDIRTSERGMELLDSIFQTETIFGKLSIY